MFRKLLARIGLVENMARQALSRAGSGSSLAKALEYTFVFRPGAVGPLAPNVFTTWPAVIAAMALVDGPKLLQIDPTFAPAVVPPGAWSLDNVTLTGRNDSSITGQPTLTFAAGATITSNLTRVTGSLGLQNTGAIVWTIPAGTTIPVLYLDENSFMVGSPGAPFIHIPAGATLAVNALDSDLGDTTNTVIQVDAGGTLDANAIGGGGFTANAVAGAGTFDLGLIVGGLFEQPQALEPVITYVDPPENFDDTNAAPISAGPLLFTSTDSITRRTSGRVRLSAIMSVTGAAAGVAVTFDLLRNPGLNLIRSIVVDGGSTHTTCTIPAIDTLPDQAAHTYAIRATQGATVLTAGVGQAAITADELT
jgi:hypothetical protein